MLPDLNSSLPRLLNSGADAAGIPEIELSEALKFSIDCMASSPVEDQAPGAKERPARSVPHREFEPGHFRSIRSLVKEEQQILARLPMACLYLLATIETAGADEEDGPQSENSSAGSSRYEDLLEGLRYASQPKVKQAVPAIKALLDEAAVFNRPFAEGASEADKEAAVTACRSAAARRERFVAELCLFNTDYENIAVLVETRSEIPRGAAAVFEIGCREELARIHKNINLLAAPVFEANQKLADAIADRFARSGLMDSSDLKREAARGLLHAVLNFEPEVGAHFGSYAGNCIAGFLKKSCGRHSRLVRLGRVQLSRLEAIERYEERYLHEHSQLPDDAEIARHLSVKDPAKIEKLQTMRYPFPSLDASRGEDPDAPGIHNLYGDPTLRHPAEHAFSNECVRVLRAAMNSVLTEKEKRALMLCFELPGYEKFLKGPPPAEDLTLDQIGALCDGVGRVSVQGARNNAIKKIRKYIEENAPQLAAELSGRPFAPGSARV